MVTKTFSTSKSVYLSSEKCTFKSLVLFIAFYDVAPSFITLKILVYAVCKSDILSQVVDMRWGVRDEATDDHMTTELCMKEIENCQRLSMGPNFVVSNLPSKIVLLLTQIWDFCWHDIKRPNYYKLIFVQLLSWSNFGRVISFNNLLSELTCEIGINVV